MKDLIKNFLLYGLGTAIGKFIAVFLLPIYAACFSPTDYGNLDLILTSSSILAAFGMLQVESALQRYYYEFDEQERKDLCFTALISVLAFSLFFLLVAISLSAAYSKLLFDGDYHILLILSFLNIIPVNSNTIIFTIFRYSNRPLLFSIINVTQVVLTISLTLYLVLCCEYGIKGVVLANLIGSTVIMVLTVYICRNAMSRRFKRDYFKNLLAFALPLFPAQFGSLSNTYLNRFFIVGRFSTFYLGLFSVGIKIASVIYLFRTALQLAWSPFMYNLVKTDNHQLALRGYIIRIVNVVLFFCLIFTLFSKEIVLLLTNSNYLEAYKVVGFISLSYGFYMLKDVCEYGINIVKKTQYITYIYLFTTLLNIAFLLVVPSQWGIMGISGVLLLSNFALMVLTLFFSEKLYCIGLPKSRIIILMLIASVFVFLLSVLDLSVHIRIVISIGTVCLLLYSEKQIVVSIFCGLLKKLHF